MGEVCVHAWITARFRTMTTAPHNLISQLFCFLLIQLSLYNLYILIIHLCLKNVFLTNKGSHWHCKKLTQIIERECYKVNFRSKCWGQSGIYSILLFWLCTKLFVHEHLLLSLSFSAHTLMHNMPSYMYFDGVADFPWDLFVLLKLVVVYMFSFCHLY